MKPNHASRTIVARVLTCLLSLAGLVLAVTGLTVAQEEPQPVVAYVNYGNIDWDGGFNEITDDHRRDEQPALSPDGQTIAYVRSFYSRMPTIRLASEIVRMKVDGTGVQRLTHNDLLESWPTWSPDGTKLAFAAGDLYVISVSAAGGGTPIRLTTGGLNPRNITWSADGTQLAFNSWPCPDDYDDNADYNPCEGSELYVVSLAGPQLKRLTDNDGHDGDPTWSPDGAQLVYETRPTPGGDRHLYRIAVAGGPPTPLVAGGDSTDPAWSPDGALIAYVSEGTILKTVQPDGTGRHTLDEPWVPSEPMWTTDSRYLIYYDRYEMCSHGGCATTEYLYRWGLDTGQNELLIESNERNFYNPGPYLSWTATNSRVAYSTQYFLRTADISGTLPASVTQLTFDAPVNGDPAWSPDGRWIAFSSQRPVDYNIHVIGPDGSGRHALTTHPGNDWNPSWSSDDQIAFTSNRDGNWEMYVMNADGSEQTNVTHTPTIAENDAAWSPSGHQLAFARKENGNWDIYVMNADGSGLTRLTSHAASDRNPTWSPNGARIAFETDRDGNEEIYILTVAGPPGNEVNWTSDPNIQREPAWSLDGTQIAFAYIYDAGGVYTSSVVSRNLNEHDHSHTLNIQYVSLNPQPAWRPVAHDGTPRVWVPVIRK